MRPFTLLPVALVTGCLLQNPGFDAGQTTDAATIGPTSTGAATTGGDITGLSDFLFAGNAVPASPMWVGGRDIDPNMNAYYTWYDGSPLSFNNFALADLDNGCISMPNGENGQWRDRDCIFTYSFACESTN